MMKYKVKHNFTDELGQFISHWGEGFLSDMMIEESAELTKELLHARRKRNNEDAVIEEVADVLFMALTMAEMTNYNKVMRVLNQKIDRTIKRMKDNPTAKNNVLQLHPDNKFFDDNSQQIRGDIAKHKKSIAALVGDDRMIRNGKIVPMPPEATALLKRAKAAINGAPINDDDGYQFPTPFDLSIDGDSTMSIKWRKKSNETYEAFRFGYDNNPIHWFDGPQKFKNFVKMLERGNYHGYYIVKHSVNNEIIRNETSRMVWGFTPTEFTNLFVPERTVMEPTEIFA